MAHTVRDRLVQRWLSTQRTYLEQTPSASPTQLGVSHRAQPGLCCSTSPLRRGQRVPAERGGDLGEVLESEGDPGLGNGGLGRLAACFMDSLATLELPAVGYGIRYDYGIFEQRIELGQQVEHRDNWLSRGNPWELARHEEAQVVRLYGQVVMEHDARGNARPVWVDGKIVIGVPYDSFIGSPAWKPRPSGRA